MSTNYAKPENALRKAKDLVRVDKRDAALNTLHVMLSSRRYRAWQPAHEEIIKLYTDLAVESQKPMRDALVQYRIITQQGGGNSMETVLNYYQTLVESKTAEIEKKADLTAELSDEKELLDLEDTPESIIMQAVSGEDAKARTDRELLAPWLKYQFEAYKTILEVLRNNNKMELFYQKTARRAFDFCLKYKRHTAFRRFCEILRTHLVSITRHQQQTNAVDLNSPETQRLYLETRFIQLRVASQLELWQEAYRTIEDIHENMQLSKEAPEPALMVTYYEKLADIFWASGNYLFHAYSLEKFYSLLVESAPADNKKDDEKKKQEDEARKKDIASAVLLATLAIPPTERFGDHTALFDESDENNERLASLLGFKKEVPTRSRLLAALQERGFLSEVSANSLAVYSALEADFGPMTLKERLSKALEGLQGNNMHTRYNDLLQRLGVVRLMQQLGKVFKTITFSKLLQIAPSTSFAQIERITMEAIQNAQLRVRIDHKNQWVIFTPDSLETDDMRLQLTTLAARLSKVAEKLQPPSEEAKRMQRENVFRAVLDGVKQEHQQVFARTELIEKIKQSLEQKQIEQEQEEERRRRMALAKRAEEERERLRAESERREKEREQREREQQELRARKTLAEQIEKKIEQTISGPKLEKVTKEIKEITSNMDNVDIDKLMSTHKKLMEEEARDKDRQQKEKARRLDYLTRAIRLLERPLLNEVTEKIRQEEKKRFEEINEKLLAEQKAIHERSLQEKHRLARTAAYCQQIIGQFQVKRQALYQEQLATQKQKLAEKRAERRREMERKRAEEAAAREAEARRRQEEEEREREEEERRAQEEEEARRIAAERSEKQRKLDEIAALQRKRELEIEARDMSRTGGPGPGRPAPVRGPAASPAGDAPRSAWGRGPPEQYRDEAPAERAPAAPGAWRGRTAPRDEEEAPARRPAPRGDEPPRRWGGAGGDEDRPPARRFGGGDDSRGPPARRPGGDDDRAPPRRFGGDDDRAPPRRFGGGDDDRAPPRRFGGGDDDRAPPRRFGGGDDDRAPPRRFGGGGDDERPPRRNDDERGPPPRRFGGGGDDEDRAPPRRFGGGDEDRPPRRDDAPRRGADDRPRGRFDDAAAPPRRDDGEWRPRGDGPPARAPGAAGAFRGGAPAREERRAPAPERSSEPAGEEESGDGFTQVASKKVRGKK